ncbi:hypothetical protein HUJ04_012342 [Dendroctonus ponderosae]|nr:hypothetical protein HUJ04_012342 [Dendroctonus ponderosae]KAH1029519.1 hypothetical protein HUJ05_002745 [Dendroctonus ponderosae]
MVTLPVLTETPFQLSKNQFIVHYLEVLVHPFQDCVSSVRPVLDYIALSAVSSTFCRISLRSEIIKSS